MYINNEEVSEGLEGRKLMPKLTFQLMSKFVFEPQLLWVKMQRFEEMSTKQIFCKTEEKDWENG